MFLTAADIQCDISSKHTARQLDVYVMYENGPCKYALHFS